MFPFFSKFAACGETPDEYNGWMLYDAEDKNFFPGFKINTLTTKFYWNQSLIFYINFLQQQMQSSQKVGQLQ